MIKSKTQHFPFYFPLTKYPKTFLFPFISGPAQVLCCSPDSHLRQSALSFTFSSRLKVFVVFVDLKSGLASPLINPDLYDTRGLVSKY